MQSSIPDLNLFAPEQKHKLTYTHETLILTLVAFLQSGSDCEGNRPDYS